MKKRLFTLLLTVMLALTLLPGMTTAVADALEVGESGTYSLTRTGLTDAIAAAVDGEAIKFVSGGEIDLDADIVIDKSITLELNSQMIVFNGLTGFEHLSITDGCSVTVIGPGTIKTNTYIHNTATLTVHGGAVIEGTGDWQTLMNYGIVSMTDGELKQTSVNAALQIGDDGVATFTDVTISTNSANEIPIWNFGTLTLNNCTTKNAFSGAGTWSIASVVASHHSGTVVLNGGSVIAPLGSTVAAVFGDISTMFTNNGATISNGYVKKLGDLSVSVSPGVGKVTLAPQTAQTGVTYYYKMTASDDSAAKPASYTSAAFAPAGWTAFSTETDIATEGSATVYVQVVKVGDTEQKIYGWGQGSTTPEATPSPSATPAPSGTPSPSETPSPSDGPADDTPKTGDNRISWVWWLFSISTAGIASIVVMRKKVSLDR